MKLRRLSEQEFEEKLEEWASRYKTAMRRLWKEKRLGEHTNPRRP